jgi:hypothetical protein
MVGRDVTEEFFSLGTYCSVEYNKEKPNKVVSFAIIQNLRGIHKVEIKGVNEYTLAYEEENNLSQFSGLIQDLSQDDPREEEHSPAKVGIVLYRPKKSIRVWRDS